MFVWTKFVAGCDRAFWDARMHTVEDACLVIAESPNRKRLRINAYCNTRKAADRMKSEFGGRISILKHQDWAAASKRPKSPPLKIRNQLLISEETTARALQRLRKAHSGRTVLSIPVEMAFGTGQHATTSTCLRMLADIAAELPNGKWKMLDLGAGTGVLAIAARVLGARSATGYDFDPITIGIARENAARNKVDGVRFSNKDVTQWRPNRQFECIAANMFFDVLIAAFPAIFQALEPGGHFILSGILATHAGECLAAAEKNSLQLERVVKRGKWVTAHARKS